MAIIQKCEVCQKAFTWKQITKSLWLAYQPIDCRNCGARHTVNFSSRITASFLMVLPILIFTLYSIGAEGLMFFVNILLIIGTISLIIPYVMKYHHEPHSREE